MPDRRGSSPAPRRIPVGRGILAANARIAEENRGRLRALRVTAVNLMGSPGAGKTTLLEETLARLREVRPVAVIEGDVETAKDARRIAATGTPVVQVETRGGCHLDARQVRLALGRLDLPGGALLFIENVGNLICPAGFDLGQHADVVLLSVTEGDDKPEKYPGPFRAAAAMVLAKVDLLGRVEFDRKRCFRFARALNPRLLVFELSARLGEGLEPWFAWLRGLDVVD